MTRRRMLAYLGIIAVNCLIELAGIMNARTTGSIVVLAFTGLLSAVVLFAVAGSVHALWKASRA